MCVVLPLPLDLPFYQRSFFLRSFEHIDVNNVSKTDECVRSMYEGKKRKNDEQNLIVTGPSRREREKSDDNDDVEREDTAAAVTTSCVSRAYINVSWYVCVRANERTRKKASKQDAEKKKKSNVNCRQNGRHRPTERPTTRKSRKKKERMYLCVFQAKARREREKRETEEEMKMEKSAPILTPSREQPRLLRRVFSSILLTARLDRY